MDEAFAIFENQRNKIYLSTVAYPLNTGGANQGRDTHSL
jgi:hypothetical protein